MVVQQQLKLSIEESHCANDCFAQGGGEKQFVEHLQLGQSLGLLSLHVAVRLFAAVVGRLGDLMARQTSVTVLPWAQLFSGSLLRISIGQNSRMYCSDLWRLRSVV